MELEHFLGTELVELVSKHKVDTIIFLGDLFNHRDYIDVQVYNIVRNKFKSLSKLARLIMIAGNHDLHQGHCTFDSFDFAEVVKTPKVISLNKINVYLVPYCRDFETRPATILLGHFSVNDLSMCRDKNSAVNSSMLSIYGKVILGHEHHPCAYHNITFAGTCFPTSFSDAGVSPRVLIVDEYEVRSIGVKTPTFHIVQELDPSTDYSNSYVRVVSKECPKDIKSKFLEYIPVRNPVEIESLDDERILYKILESRHISQEKIRRIVNLYKEFKNELQGNNS